MFYELMKNPGFLPFFYRQPGRENAVRLEICWKAHSECYLDGVKIVATVASTSRPVASYLPVSEP